MFSVILLFTYHCRGQEKDTVFIDETNLIITPLKFNKKKNSNLYYNYSYEMDSVVYSKVFLNYYIGKLSSTKKHQLFGLLSQRNNVDITKSILIHYIDTLKSIKSYPRRDSMVSLEGRKHHHFISHKTFIKRHISCLSKNNTKKLNTYHFYNFNEGHPSEIRKIKWHIDPLQLLRKIFYNKDNNENWWVLLIHPNGDYVIKNKNLPTQLWNQLKKHKNWEEHKVDFLNRYYSLNPHLKI